SIHLIHCNRATLDLNQMVGIAPEESNDSIFDVNSDPVPISVLVGRRSNRTYGRILDLTDPTQSIVDLLPFNLELMLICHVFIGAAATSAKIWAGWRHAMRRSLLNLDQFGFGKLLFLAQDLRGNHFVFNDVRDKDSFPILASDPFASKSDVFD